MENKTNEKPDFDNDFTFYTRAHSWYKLWGPTDMALIPLTNDVHSPNRHPMDGKIHWHIYRHDILYKGLENDLELQALINANVVQITNRNYDGHAVKECMRRSADAIWPYFATRPVENINDFYDRVHRDIIGHHRVSPEKVTTTSSYDV